ncbi:MAG TPA: M20 family peptidase [Nitrospiraceae bacterium]|nr:M20 family peptidase [Nitrospiraceae bacterium]
MLSEVQRRRRRRRFRRLLLMITLGLLALVGVLLFRTLTMTSRQIAVAPGPAIQIDAAAAAARLAQALPFRTISYQDPSQFSRDAFLGLHQYLVKTFPETHRTLQRELVNDYSVLYTWVGTEPTLPPMLLLGHLDVVPIESGTEKEWTYPPFSGTLADGYIWGRGAMDDKVGVLGALEAVEHLLRQRYTPRRTVLLAFGHDEEVGGQAGAKSIVARLAQTGMRPVLILDEGMAILKGIVPGIDRSIASIGLAEKGYLSVELLVDGAGGHASMPPAHTNVGILASAIHALESHPMPAHTDTDGPAGALFQFLGPEMSMAPRMALANLWLFDPVLKLVLDRSAPTRALIRTTFAATMLEGSNKENVLPVRARAVVNVRVHPSDSIEQVMEHMTQAIGDPRVTVRRLAGVMSEPSAVSPRSSIFTTLQRTVGQQFPDAIVAPGLVLGATDSRHYQTLSEQVYRFLPLQVDASDIARIHGVNERLAVDHYADAIAFYIRLIQNFND